MGILKTASEKELIIESILLLHKMLLTNIRDEVVVDFARKAKWYELEIILVFLRIY